MNESDTLPVIRLALGDSMDTVRERSTHTFPEGPLDPYHPFAVNQAVRVEYTRTEGELRFPLALFVGLTTNAGHVTSAQVSPQLRLLTEDEVLALAETLIKLVDDAGWRRDAKRQGTPAERMERLKRRGARGTTLQRWWHGDDQLTLELRRSPDAVRRSAAFRPDDPPRAFTLRVSFYNKPIASRYGEQRRRLQQGE